MKLQCPHCQAVLDFGDRPLSFCAYCGHSLSGSTPAASALAEAPTADPNATTPPVPMSEASTLAPGPGMPGTARDDPAVVGNYRLLRPLGGGGMGTVYEAEEIGSGRRVALKLINSGYADSEDAVERFRQEGRLASALVHPRCVFIYAADEQGGRPYIVMELMPGKTIEDLVRESGPLPIDDAVETIMDVIDGLQEAHHAGIIHRDVKPSNCFLEEDGRVKVGDFGLAKSLAANVRLTGTGAFLGTPLYASPEQVRAEKLTPQTDVYSVTATLYFLLAGKAPFESGDAVSTLARIVSEDPSPVRTLRPEVPEVLDAIIRRGLERSRERRFADLEELRVALVPFLPGRSPIVGLGMRFGAYLIDYMLLAFIRILLSFSGVFTAQSDVGSGGIRVASARGLVAGMIEMLTFLFYFLPEGFVGYSVGKGLVGLRVLGAGTLGPPGLWRCLLRSAVFYLLLSACSLIALILIVTVPNHIAASEFTPRLLIAGLLGVISTPVGVALVCSTMRTRNGLRGLHEFASGTRVVRLIQPRRRMRFRLPSPQQEYSLPANLPASVGLYPVKAALHWQDRLGTLLAQDPGLGRDVLIWLRPGVGPPLDTTRRALGRITRLRWLAAGRYESAQWDAFLLPAGCTLPELVRSAGPLDWQDARSLLEQLTKELMFAIDEQTLPPSLSAEQVWVQANGRVVLLDAPASPTPAAQKREPAQVLPLEEQQEEMSLALLREAAVLMMAGQPGSLRVPLKRRAAPVPLHALDLLRRLQNEEDGCPDLAAFRAELRETRSLPVEVTRARRAAQQAVLAGLLFFGLASSLVPLGLASVVLALRAEGHLRTLKNGLNEFEQASRTDLAVRVLNPNLWARLAGVAQYAADRELSDRLRERVERDTLENEARIKESNPLIRPSLLRATGDQSQTKRQAGRWRQGQSFRLHADALVRQGLNTRQPVGEWASIALLIWPTIWVLWAFATRGGFSYRITGLALVRRDDRPAARWQCAWRTFIVWLPVIALFLASVWLADWYWATWQPHEPRRWALGLSRLAWWGGLGLLAAFVGLALRSPGRAPNDWLAGTFVVPR
jgi:hypothetical protein